MAGASCLSCAAWKSASAKGSPSGLLASESGGTARRVVHRVRHGDQRVSCLVENAVARVGVVAEATVTSRSLAVSTVPLSLKCESVRVFAALKSGSFPAVPEPEMPLAAAVITAT